MRLLTDNRVAGQRSDTLLVMLPPALANIDDFVSHGFLQAVRRRNLDVDLLFADTNGQQVIDRTVVDDLHTEVILPARALGYSSIWLAGISMGAFSALHYAAHHSAQLAGLYLLAPYPGTGDVLAEIRESQGAVAWSQVHVAQDDERIWWHWLAQQNLRGQWTPPVYFGTGNSDRFFKGQLLLCDTLPHDRVHIIPGDHQWPTWKALWEDWLEQGPLGSSLS